jgi:hypothetical protein
MVVRVRLKKARKNLRADKSTWNQMAHENLEFSLSVAFRFRYEGDHMKNIRFVLLALTVLLMATATQAQKTKVRAIVPFDFVVGDRAYPAGEYFLNPMADNDTVIRIDNTQEPAAGHVSSNACTGATPSAKTKLVFRRMGDNYHLYQVWVEGRLSGREFLMSRTEVQLARNHEKPELVIVDAKISH